MIALILYKRHTKIRPRSFFDMPSHDKGGFINFFAVDFNIAV